MGANYALSGGFIKKVDTITSNKKAENQSAPILVEKKGKSFVTEKKSINFLDKEKPNGFFKRDKKTKTSKKENKKIIPVKDTRLQKIKKCLIGTAIGIFVTIFLALLSFSGAVFAYQYESYDQVLYGVTFMEEELGGMNRSELAKTINKNLSEIKLNFEVEGEEVTYSPSEAGITFKDDLITSEAHSLRKGGKWHEEFMWSSYSYAHKHSPEYLKKYFKKYEKQIDIKYQIDEKTLTDFTNALSGKYNVEEKNAGLVMNGAEVTVIPAVYGKQLVTGAIRAQIEGALSSNNPNKIVINAEEVDPKILEEDTQASIRAAQEIINKNVTYTYEDKKYTATKAEIGGWIVFREVDGSLKPEVDGGMVKIYIDNKVAKDVNIAVVNQQVKIINGAKQEVTRVGADGLAVNSISLSADTATILNSGQNVNKVIPTYPVKFKTVVNNVIVADWSKYITINISTQTMCAYLAGGIEQGCWKVTTGASKWATPKGTFLIRRKSGAGGVAGGPGGGGVCMPNPPSKTPLCGINYVSTFTAQGHAIHEAWWRTYTSSNHFGNPNYSQNGSHGCINAYYDVAKWIYNWAPIGTPIIIH